jgi:hypothetical protein
VHAADFILVNEKIPKIFKKPLEFKKPRMVTGIHDICIPFKKGTWGDLLKSVIDFRGLYSKSLLDTQIEITVPIETTSKSRPLPKNASDTLKYPELNLGETATAAILERPGTPHLISTLYGLNNFFQDRLLRDTFLDLFIPAERLIRQVCRKDPSGKWLVDDTRVNELLRRFQYAMRERAMGAYLFTEKDEHSFSPIKGGLQRILLALEAIPFSLLKILLAKREIPWQGFVSIGLQKEPMHFYENLHIPFEHALYPDKYWWCCIHEIGHALVLVLRILSTEHFLIKNALERLPNQSQANIHGFLNMADNCFSDIFDFLVGFLANRSLYFKICWPFLLENIKEEYNSQEIFRRHLVRHFVGWIYEKVFLLRKKSASYIDNFENLIDEANTFLKELNKAITIPKYVGNHSELTENLVDESMNYICLLEHFDKHLKPVIELSNNLKKEYRSKRLERVIKIIEEDGQIASPDLIRFPHLIPLKLMEAQVEKNEPLRANFRTRIATILSLYWYSQKNYIPSILEVYSGILDDSS